MSAKPKINPLFFAPFVSSVMRPEPAWIDENDHLNMAYYHVFFDRTLEEAFDLLGLDKDYCASGPGTVFVAESHVSYRREILRDMPVRVTAQLLDYDVKRMHLSLEMRHAKDGWLAAAAEFMMLHILRPDRKVGPFPTDILDAIAVMKSAHAALPRPDHIGRIIAIPDTGRSGKVGLH